MNTVMRNIVKKNSIFIIAILNLLMFIISCIVFYWSGYIRDQYNIMNDGEYFETFYLICIVIIEIFVFSLIYFLRQYKLGIYKVFYLLYIVLLMLFVYKTINYIIYYNNYIIYYNNYSKEEYSKSHKVSLQNLNYIIKETSADSIVYIFRSSCSMCKSIQPLIDDYSKNSKYMVYYYDTVDDRNSNYSAMIDTLKSIGVETVPTLVIMHNGEVYRRYTDKELYKLLKE